MVRLFIYMKRNYNYCTIDYIPSPVTSGGGSAYNPCGFVSDIYSRCTNNEYIFPESYEIRTKIAIKFLAGSILRSEISTIQNFRETKFPRILCLFQPPCLPIRRCPLGVPRKTLIGIYFLNNNNNNIMFNFIHAVFL